MKTKSLIRICNIIAFLMPAMYLVFLVVVMAQASKMGTNFAKMGARFSMPFMYEMWVGLVLMIGVCAACVVFFYLVYHVKKGKVFFEKNEKNLIGFGLFIILCAIAAAVLTAVYSVNILAYYASGILFLTGTAFVFFALILKIGRKMQEEQELTI